MLYLVIYFMLLLGFENKSSANATVVPDEMYASTSDALVIMDNSKLAKYKIRAMQGDLFAAVAVANHHSVSLNPLHYTNKDSYTRAETARLHAQGYWLAIAAENDVISSRELSHHLASEGGTANCYRAIFWLKKFKGTWPSKWNTPKYAIVRDEEFLLSLENKTHKCWKKH